MRLLLLGAMLATAGVGREVFVAPTGDDCDAVGCGGRRQDPGPSKTWKSRGRDPGWRVRALLVVLALLGAAGAQERWARGEWVPSPPVRLTDPATGRTILNLTHGVGRNRPIYFNRANFTGDGRYLVFLSDRTGSWQVYAHDLVGHRVRRLTDCTRDPGRPCIDPQRPVIYFTQGNAVQRLALETLDEQVIYTHPTPAGGSFLLLDISADGRYLGGLETGPYERDPDSSRDFVRRFEARPLSSLWVLTSDGAKAWKAHEESRHLQHLLFCPTDPTTLLFCHEGPWNRVEQRLWLVRWDGADLRPLRVEEDPRVEIGHEYWLPDGRTVAYAFRSPGAKWSVRTVDVARGRETVLTEHPYAHFIGDAQGRFIVGDDPTHVTLFDLATRQLTPLAGHGQELSIRNTLFHPHPAFSPDGRQVVFCRRDGEGHNDVCLIPLEP